MTKPIALVFGATGAIGTRIADWFSGYGYEVWAGSRQADKSYSADSKTFVFNIDTPEANFKGLKSGSVTAVVWAQGANLSDSIRSLELEAHRNMYEANVVYILAALQTILKLNLLAPSARLCVISSIWQNLAKQEKLSYCVTKSAIQGLVQSLAIDLGKEGVMINAVLPGALDTPMTRANLTHQQIDELTRLTPLGSLATLEDVANLVGFLCSEANSGITGQFINADRGFSHARII